MLLQYMFSEREVELIHDALELYSLRRFSLSEELTDEDKSDADMVADLIALTELS